jgi:hypothetical protein
MFSGCATVPRHSSSLASSDPPDAKRLAVSTTLPCEFLAKDSDSMAFAAWAKFRGCPQCFAYLPTFPKPANFN